VLKDLIAAQTVQTSMYPTALQTGSKKKVGYLSQAEIIIGAISLLTSNILFLF
jgi:hypothetical protein